MLKLNVEICVQKPEFAFWDKHLIHFLLASIPSTYERIINNLNLRDILTLDGTVRAFRKEETELTDLRAIKEDSVEVEETVEELERAEFLEPLMEVMQFKIFLRAPQ